MNKKFEFTGETKAILGNTLHRIRALISFGEVGAGELGGWIEKEENLDASGNAWVYGNAQVSGNAQVYGNACVYGDAWVSGNAWVYGDAWVFGNARVYGIARLSGNARVYGDARVYGNARVSGNAWVYGDAWVFDNARVDGDACVYGDARVDGDARVYKCGAIFWISNVGSRDDTATFFACRDKKIKVIVGCFFGDLDEFAAAVQKTHGDNTHAKVYRLAIEMAKERIKMDDMPEESNDG